MKKSCIMLSVFGLLLLTHCSVSQQEKLHSNSAKEALGHYLFFENRLSINHTKSCASCHSPEFAFTDGYRRSTTALGENVLHNAPSLINSVFLHYYDWANENATSLRQQIKRPLYHENPIELGLHLHAEALQNSLKHDSLYMHLFEKAFPGSDTFFTLSQIEECLISYEKQLVSMNTAFDKHKMSKEAQQGFLLFSSPELNCITCHPPPYFTLAANTFSKDSVFVNIGLYNVAGKNTYPDHDRGIYKTSRKKSDDGKFKIPSLRNVLLTSPYMHDGSVANIEEVIDIYARGGRNITYGDYKGDGKENKYKHPLIKGFTLTSAQKKDLIYFLASLTDTTVATNALFKNPF